MMIYIYILCVLLTCANFHTLLNISWRGSAVSRQEETTLVLLLIALTRKSHYVP